jgi:phage portal protein BeeE
MAEARESGDGEVPEAVREGRPLMLNNGFTWHALSINPDDAQMLESRASASRKSAASSACRRS